MRDRRQQQVTAVVFGAILAVLLVAMLFNPARAKSELENRDLAQKPAVPQGVQDLGAYAKNWDSYLLDQVPFRDAWVRSYYFTQMRILGKQEMNGVVVGKDGYLLALPSVPAGNEAELEAKISSAIEQASGLDKTVRDYGGHLLYVGVPTKRSFLRADYPAYVKYPGIADKAEQDFFAALAQNRTDGLNLRPVLESHRDRQLYYRTDHHWTFAGAFLGYSAVMQRLGLPAFQEADLNMTTVPNTFIGSRNRSLGMVMPNPDRISLGVPKTPVASEITLVSDGGKARKSYHALPKRGSDSVSYSTLYPYANLGEVLIDTHRPDLPDLLVIGDSFKGAIDDLLLTGFDQTRQIDLRTYKAMSMIDYVTLYKPDYVVVLLNGFSYIVPPWNVFDKPSNGGTTE